MIDQKIEITCHFSTAMSTESCLLVHPIDVRGEQVIQFYSIPADLVTPEALAALQRIDPDETCCLLPADYNFEDEIKQLPECLRKWAGRIHPIHRNTPDPNHPPEEFSHGSPLENKNWKLIVPFMPGCP